MLNSVPIFVSPPSLIQILKYFLQVFNHVCALIIQPDPVFFSIFRTHQTQRLRYSDADDRSHYSIRIATPPEALGLSFCSHSCFNSFIQAGTVSRLLISFFFYPLYIVHIITFLRANIRFDLGSKILPNQSLTSHPQFLPLFFPRCSRMLLCCFLDGGSALKRSCIGSILGNLTGPKDFYQSHWNILVFIRFREKKKKAHFALLCFFNNIPPCCSSSCRMCYVDQVGLELIVILLPLSLRCWG